MDLRTFQQWSNAGYKILKGSKATWVDNVAMFSEKQVTKRPPRLSFFRSRADYTTYEDDFDRYGWVEAFPGADGWGSD